jgi:hypothetical protein
MATETLAQVATRLAKGCPITSWTGNLEACRWCNGHLTRGQAAFCCRLCSTTFWANHSWTAAKRAVKERARRKCERCGKAGGATAAVHHVGGAVEGGRTRLAACDHHLDLLRFECWACHQGSHHGDSVEGDTGPAAA